MTYNATYLVGCGFAYCDESQFEKYYVCNYAPGYVIFNKYLYILSNFQNQICFLFC